MRRTLLVLTLLVGAFFALGAAPGVASAANCNSGMGATYYDGMLNFAANLTNCTNVDIVDFRNTVGGGEAGWTDYSTASFIRATYPVGIIEIGGACCMTGASQIFQHAPWCNHNVHNISTQFGYRIHNAVTHTWGSWFQAISSHYDIIC